MNEGDQFLDNLTVIILTFNEAQHLAACISSAKRVSSRVLVLDSGSTDDTLAIAASHGAEVQARAFDGYASQRNAALQMVDTEWVFFLDADEWISEELAAEIRSTLLDADGSVHGVRVHRQNRIGERVLRGGGWWPDTQLRIFRRLHGRYDPDYEVHERPIVPGRHLTLEQPLIHHNYTSLADVRQRQRQYLPLLVRQHLESNDIGRRRTLVGRPVREFWRRYVSLRGYRDGFVGLYLAMAMAWYEFRMWRSIRSSDALLEPRDSIHTSIQLSDIDPDLDISVVIASYNTSELLSRCLASIEAWFMASNRSGEVIVVDNASNDGTVNMLKRRFPDVRLIENRHNTGYAAANNQGMRAARGKYIVLLNPDTTVVGDAFGVMANRLDHNPDIGVVGPQLRYPDGAVQSSRRRFPTRRTAFLESTLVQEWWSDNRVLRRYYIDDRSDHETQDVDWLVGACLMVRREAIEQTGMFDEQFFMYSEEIDWCFRMKQTGWRVVYLPDATITHHEGASSGQDIPARQIHFDTSKVLLYRKLYGPVFARLLHVFLITTYLLRIGLEFGKALIGHKRTLRLERIRSYWQVLVTRIRGTKGTP